MAWRQTERTEFLPARTTRKSTDSHGCIGRAIDSGTRVGNGIAAGSCHDGDAQRIGCFPLIGGHTKGGIALDMLDSAEPF
ncbi:MAG: Uncharacterised protein [SAR116 cluster bacterium]|nr:MAG: Uncharacterised protein [SAR116 cluster bacterium]